MKDVRITRTYDLPANVTALWPVLSDTHRMNRMFGLPQLAFTHTPRTAGRPLVTGTTSQLGQVMTWEEHPFEWVEHQRYSVLRTYRNGPFSQVRIGFNIKGATADRTQVEIEVVASPRSSLAGGLLALLRNAVANKWGTILHQMAVYASGQAAEVDRRNPYDTNPLVVAACEPFRAPLTREGFSPDAVQKLFVLLASRPDDELVRMRPYALASRLGLSRRDALRLFMFGTRAGLLSMSWDLLCPHCRGASVHADSLGGVVPSSACDSCGIQFDVEFDRNVEITFSPNNAVRKLSVVPFCSGGPSVTPHVRVQQKLAAQEARSLQVELRPGRYRIRASGVPGTAVLEVGGEPATDAATDVTVTAQGVVVPAGTVPSQVTLRLHNQTDSQTVVCVESGEWLDDAVTAATLTALQDFRDLFGREVLATGNNIRVGQVTLMFTDLKGSTALYEEVGDVRAFALVQDHFKLLANAVRESQGAIVKTIGDAVMAVFDRPDHAVQCALEVQRRAQSLKGHDGRDVIIKIGVHCGPCLAVEQNEQLDYFGNMVNLAARVQNESVGRDVVLTQAIVSDATVKPLLEGLAVEPFGASLRGIKGAIPLLRAWPLGKLDGPAVTASDGAAPPPA